MALLQLCQVSLLNFLKKMERHTDAGSWKYFEWVLVVCTTSGLSLQGCFIVGWAALLGVLVGWWLGWLLSGGWGCCCSWGVRMISCVDLVVK